jgi:hypothetical protein
MAALAKRVQGDGRIRHVKDATYLAWRFGRHGNRYRFLFLGGRELDGYVVLHSWGDRGAAVRVVDWEVTHPRLLADLLSSAVQLGRFPSLSVPWVGSPGPLTDALEEAGFAFADAGPSSGASRSPYTVEVNRLRSRAAGPWTLGDRDLLNPLDWDLRFLYADRVT